MFLMVSDPTKIPTLFWPHFIGISLTRKRMFIQITLGITACLVDKVVIHFPIAIRGWCLKSGQSQELIF